MEGIKKGDTVLHMLSHLYFRCENTQQARWMNLNPYYRLVPSDVVPDSYFLKY